MKYTIDQGVTRTHFGVLTFVIALLLLITFAIQQFIKSKELTSNISDVAVVRSVPVPVVLPPSIAESAPPTSDTNRIVSGMKYQPQHYEQTPVSSSVQPVPQPNIVAKVEEPVITTPPTIEPEAQDIVEEITDIVPIEVDLSINL